MASKKPVTAVAAKAPIQAKGKAFDAKQHEKPGLTAEQVTEIKAAFDLFDTDSGGSIDTKGNS